MAQHDYVIANGTGAAVRSDLNAGFAAIVSQNSGATAPSTTYAYQSWADTSAGVMKMRNGANNAWISLYELDGTFLAGDISLSAGAAATPSLFFTGDTNTGIYSPGADQFGISTGGTSRLAVSTTAISSTLAVDHPLGAVGTPSITFTGDLNTGIWSPTADTIAASTAGSERVRIDSSGGLLVGTSTSTSVSSVGYVGKVQIANSGNAGLGLHGYYNGPLYGADILFTKSNSNTIGTNTLVASGNELGVISWAGANGTGYDRAASIKAEVDGTPGASNDMPGRLVFSTTADGAASLTERMRITSTGQVRLAGAGITFNGDTATANELDDYEEGTWTPTYAGAGGSAGSAAYSSNGKYTKVGNVVTVWGDVTLTNKGSWTGAVVLGGLPFTSAAGRQNLGSCALTVTVIAAQTFYQSRLGPSEAVIAFFKITNNGTDAYLDVADIANTSAMRFTLSYTV